MTKSISYRDILNFWFDKDNKSKWFVSNEAFDQLIKLRFSDIYEQAIQRKLSSWDESPKTILALIIILDQFPRNMFRDSPLSFASDKQALEYTKHALSQNFDKELPSDEMRHFLYMPLMHSENIEDQILSVDSFSSMPHILPYAQQHMDVIKRFGRFPTRNKALSRNSTLEEIKLLQESN
jgi:uncharacterized protein (DUF924 family)